MHERELIKMASLAAAVTKALHARGVKDPAASLAAEAGVTVFRVGFDRWVAAKRPSDLATHIRAAVEALKAITARTPPSRRKKPAPQSRRS